MSTHKFSSLISTQSVKALHMKLIAIIFAFCVLSSNAQTIEPGFYAPSNPGFSSFTFRFNEDNTVTTLWSSCTNFMQGKGTYTITDSQLIISVVQHPLDTFTPEVFIEYDKQEQRDSVEVAIILPQNSNGFALNEIKINGSPVKSVKDSFHVERFKVPIASLPCTITTSIVNHLGSIVSININRHYNTFIEIGISPYLSKNFLSYYKQGTILTFKIRDITNKGFTIINDNEECHYKHHIKK